MKWKNKLTDILKIDYPIVQAPMLGVTTPEMVAAISNCGGLGSLPVGGLPAEKTLELVRKTKQLTNKPFAVNLFAHTNPPIDVAAAETMQDFLASFCASNNIPYQKQPVELLKAHSYEEQIDLLAQENLPIVSFTFGVINDASIKALKRKGAILIGTATSVKEAQILAEKGIDIITAQGIEAGGHRGSFWEHDPLPQIGLFALLPQIADSVPNPVLAAGGICDSRTIKAAFELGASGVQVGTAFIASTESMAIPSYKAALAQSTDTGTVLTKAFSGRWARGIKTDFITSVEEAGIAIPAYPIQASLVAQIRLAAQQNDWWEYMALWAGQSAKKAEIKTAVEIFIDLSKNLFPAPPPL